MNNDLLNEFFTKSSNHLPNLPLFYQNSIPYNNHDFIRFMMNHMEKVIAKYTMVSCRVPWKDGNEQTGFIIAQPKISSFSFIHCVISIQKVTNKCDTFNHQT